MRINRKENGVVNVDMMVDEAKVLAAALVIAKLHVGPDVVCDGARDVNGYHMDVMMAQLEGAVND